MTWRLLARAVAGIHIAYALFVVAGSLLVLRWPALMWIHLLAVLWGGATLMFDFGCPLTPMEKRLWTRGGVTPYEEGFLQHHILRTNATGATERRNHIVLGAAAIAVNAVVYFLILTRG